ncbi:PAAR domain-containing protein [Ralstonia solanacearum]|uniref:PAAR domain-containing protein n=1 Tax=Ralstonia solanacearum TaxID=305 RepID=UPI0001816755|nr:PAAR domain-containing protein [Ralstonia solanacearum]MDC6179715.1 PAAR domain-containing protein [Ralstonia solanacearum]MDC6239593.1 PAAR domain-containing protein [Ralstonia solanacearum]TYZ56024.1 PAAR domain-containing protein [Ralstonia solanacearum]
MARPLIVLGDKTTHGGTVITADMTSTTHGKAMARIGDMTVCPKCKGTFPITEATSIISDGGGRGYARHMDGTACGAKLLASQSVTTSDDGGASGAAASKAGEIAGAAAAIATPVASGVCLECLVKAAASGGSTVVRS